ncbi:TPA: hypothetical protein OZV68_004529 [Escherichia coli]|uniref:hypothetical protein n=1 Tax=Escherichia coli TaxID=562 RepID=UPI000D6A0B28|nr:hypothetical protein [Escherichia coli]HCX5694320.1 hypothetical protein [Escherichia coli]
MAGIQVPDVFNHPDLPQGESVADALLLDTGLDHWFQSDYEFVTLNGTDIISFNDRVTATAKLNRAGENNGASLLNNLFSGYPGARFNSAESDRSMFNGSTPDLTHTFSWTGIATLRTLAASSNLCGTFSTSTVRTIINVSVGGNKPGKLAFLYGTSSCYGPVLDLNTPFVFACGYDGENIFLRVNGETVSAVAAGSPSASQFALGALPGGDQFWNGDVGDFFMCNVALNAPEGAGLLKKFIEYYKTTYGLNL